MSSERDGLPVGEVSRLTGVTVRTLHHYDQVGLLVPADRSASGYRLYGKADLDRLRRILGYRELGFGLDEIAGLLAEGLTCRPSCAGSGSWSGTVTPSSGGATPTPTGVGAADRPLPQAGLAADHVGGR